MAVVRVRRSMRAIAIGVTVATAPLCIVSCASASTEGEAQGAELRAAAGSDVLAMPAETVYEVTSVTLTDPTAAQLGDVDLSQLQSDGSLVLNDGIITEASLSFTLANSPAVSFVLTEPLVLRKNEGFDQAINATGTLVVDGVERPGTPVELVPRFEDDGRAEFDVEFDLPESVLPQPDDGIAFSTPSQAEVISARVELAAR
ncbi:hypothetical protein JD276_11625 [Leucobacter sp. CSA1]|uniref:YceI family protein n=1 Tax=Leucobacter chromiisoli TaxID=2796471 RepID=A0A934Q8Z3_9MICO|nr:hypothetical protein [Leucobacter chromiisoli]MBK0419683.1 hypothetical protein [Leucobacter chromiisoli]